MVQLADFIAKAIIVGVFSVLIVVVCFLHSNLTVTSEQ